MNRRVFVALYWSRGPAENQAQAQMIGQHVSRDYRFRGWYEKDSSDFWKYLVRATVQQSLTCANLEFCARVQLVCGMPCWPVNYVGAWAREHEGGPRYPGVLFYDHQTVHWSPEVIKTLVEKPCIAVVWEA